MDFSRGNFEEVSVLTHRDLTDEVITVVDLSVGLSDNFALFLIGGEVLYLIGHAAVLTHAVGRLDEAEFVDAGVGRKRVDQADVRTFRGLDRADTTIVRGMNVAHFKAGALAVQTARPKRGQAALVRHLGERVDLIHELRQLRTGKEVADHRGESLRVDQLLRRD